MAQAADRHVRPAKAELVSVLEERNQTIASVYLGVLVTLDDVDWGLDDEQQERIAEAFKQAEETVKRALGGDTRFRIEVV